MYIHTYNIYLSVYFVKFQTLKSWRRTVMYSHGLTHHPYSAIFNTWLVLSHIFPQLILKQIPDIILYYL